MVQHETKKTVGMGTSKHEKKMNCLLNNIDTEINCNPVNNLQTKTNDICTELNMKYNSVQLLKQNLHLGLIVAGYVCPNSQLTEYSTETFKKK